ncbi:hypothetical protein BGZ60DRAFT_526606 [Tricladium varicosporioides]|nr:hypothetical protein BGZ60DRAFT_526606 [Hymenoscyphus varicosporioides]
MENWPCSTAILSDKNRCLLPKERELLEEWREDFRKDWEDISKPTMAVLYAVNQTSPGFFAIQNCGVRIARNQQSWKLVTRKSKGSKKHLSPMTYWWPEFQDEELQQGGEQAMVLLGKRTSALLAYNACLFYGHEVNHKIRSRCKAKEFACILPDEACSLFNWVLPVELQLLSLQMLPIHEGDRLVRTAFPHLIVPWISTLQQRLFEWFDDLCSRQNFQYIGSEAKSDLELEVRRDIYRLRSLNLHPDLRLPSSYGNRQSRSSTQSYTPPPLGFTPWADAWQGPPTLDFCQDALQTSIMHLCLCFNKQHKAAGVFRSKGERDGSVNDDLLEWFRKTKALQILKEEYKFHYLGGDEVICTQCHADVKRDLPFVIDLDSDLNIEHNAIWKEWDSGTKQIIALPSLLIFADELQDIMKNMEILLRPMMWKCEGGLWGLNQEEGTTELTWTVPALKKGIDTYCWREVPQGQKLRCKHEDVPENWLQERGTCRFMMP